MARVALVAVFLLLEVHVAAQLQPSAPEWLVEEVHEIRSRLNARMIKRFDELLNATVTPACADEVAISYEAFITAHVTETLLPFEGKFVENKCPLEPAARDKVYPDPEELRLLYVLLVHRDASQTMRLIRSLQDGDRSHFVVHVDGKVPIPIELEAYANKSTNVFVMREGRVNVTWGGFSVVQATLNAMSYGFFLGLKFDRIINLSGTTYPLATPREIRAMLSRFATDDELMYVDRRPNVPSPKAWHYFVECDNRLHRIARLGLPYGLPLRTGSQWFIISRRFGEYLLQDEDLVTPYMAYARHIIVADENFFATILLNSPFCHHHVNANFLYVKFDKWEDEKDVVDEAKCLQPDPRYCGRSPVLLTKVDVPRLMANASTYLFARKFDGPAAAEAMDEVDRLLQLREGGEEAIIIDAAGSGVLGNTECLRGGRTGEPGGLQPNCPQTPSAVAAAGVL